MWSRLYRNHFIMAFPSFDTATNAWAPQADISWSGGPSRESEFIRFPKRVMTEREAVTFALKMGQSWINRRLKYSRLTIGSDRGKIVDMIGSLRGPEKTTLKGRVPTFAERRMEKPFTFDQFKSAMAATGLRISSQKLEKSYAALVKLRKNHHLSWAETRRKVESLNRELRSARPVHQQSRATRLPLTERAWKSLANSLTNHL